MNAKDLLNLVHRSATCTSSDSLSVKPTLFDSMAKVHGAQTTRLKYLRYGFQLSSATISGDIAKAFARHKDKGQVQGSKLTTAQLKRAFRNGINIRFDSKALEHFPGKWIGINRSYDLNTGKENQDRATTWNMTWEKGTKKGDEYTQRVVGSKEKHYRSNELPPLTDKKVDLALNVYRKNIGITGWLSMYVEFRLELALISYQFGDDTFLWIGQFLSENFEPMFGENRFWMFLEWIDFKMKPISYYMYGLQFDLDFDIGSAKVVGDDVRKAKFKRISK